MIYSLETNDMDGTHIYPAGYVVPAGRYRNIETRCDVFMEHEGRLPASLDGRVAHYRRVEMSLRQTEPSTEGYVTEWEQAD